MMRPDDLQGWMLKLADAASGDVHNHVYVMRSVLTSVYMQGFEDGHRSADRDDFVRREIERKAQERRGGDGDV